MSDLRKFKPRLILMILGQVAFGVALLVAALISEPEPAVEIERADPAPEASRVARSSDSRPHAGEASPAAAKPRTKPNRMARDLARERIWDALSERHGLQPAAAGCAAPSPSAASLLPSLDRKYVRDALEQQFEPVALECYNRAPGPDRSLGTNLSVEVTIVGAEDVGGVVEEIEVDVDAQLATPFMRECLRESALALTFDPPAVGGRVKAKYPLTFGREHEG